MSVTVTDLRSGETVAEERSEVVLGLPRYGTGVHEYRAAEG